ncbi:MAG: hypothetical protein JEY96_11080 [Bacteroidales bacterium]|nr:hypothetical protein [Bacteroidales bacterium]
MKNILFINFICLLLISCLSPKYEKNQSIFQADTENQTNDFYDNAKTNKLPIQALKIDGEIENPGTIDFSNLPLRSIIVKETILGKDGKEFLGAYRYDGYSLHDILNLFKINKKNKKEFKPIIDLYLEIENDKGEIVKISWGEIFLSNHLNEIIIASQVMRIKPTKTDDLWPLPNQAKLIISSDLVTERNILNPTKITVKSYPKSFVTVKGLRPLYSPTLDVYTENKLVETLTENPTEMQVETFNTTFYGQGRGIHSLAPFKGVLLKNVLEKHVVFNKKNIREGLFLIVAKDGFRGVYTYSEIMNRDDQSEIMLMCYPEAKDNGIFRVFPSSDFFSDRAIKGITGIYFSANEQ